MGRRTPAVIVVLALGLSGCSIKKLAVNSLGNALAKGGSAYSRDDDPDLVAGAVPFGLKTVESLLDESPRHRGLLFAAVSGFTQYAYAFVEQEADFAESRDLERAKYLRGRARKLYKRALDYGLRGLEVDAPNLRTRLRKDAPAALAGLKKEHVGLLYWTSLAWGASIALSKEDPELTADQDLAEALMKRALALDDGFEYGSIHDFYIAWDGGRPASGGGSVERARQHFERALALAKGHRAAPYVAFAETVSVGSQDRREFQALLEQALAVDVDKVPELRLSNLIYQKRARWLLSRSDELFAE